MLDVSVGPTAEDVRCIVVEMMEDTVSESLLTLRCTIGLHCGLVLVVTRMAPVLLGLLT